MKAGVAVMEKTLGETFAAAMKLPPEEELVRARRLVKQQTELIRRLESRNAELEAQR